MHLTDEIITEDIFPGVSIDAESPFEHSVGNYIYSKTQLRQQFNGDKAMLMILDKMFGDNDYGLSEHSRIMITIYSARSADIITSLNHKSSLQDREFMVSCLQEYAYSYVGWETPEMMIHALTHPQDHPEKVSQLKAYMDEKIEYRVNLQRLTQAKLDMLHILGAEQYAMVLGE